MWAYESWINMLYVHILFFRNSVFQFLRLTIYPQYVEEKEKPINIIFQNIMKKMDNKSTYSPNT